MELRRSFAALAALVVVGIGLQSASAATFKVNNVAQADITAAPSGGHDIITIVLTNLTPALSTASAGNLLTGIQLVPTNIAGSGFSITGQTGAKEFTFGTQTTGAISSGTFDPTWALTTAPSGLYFNGFGTGGVPIIGGPAAGGTTYANANSSLTSGPHGTYIYETATFTIQGPSSFDLSAITSVNFLFNTSGDIVVNSGPPTGGGGGGAGQPAPLPASVWGGAALIAGLAAIRRFTRKSA